MGSKISRELALLVTGKDVSASRTLKGVSRQISGLEKHSSKAASNIGRNLERGIVIGAGAATVAIGFAVKSAMDWESAMAGVAKTVDGDVTDIGKGILNMSRKIPIAADELADLAATAGALGVAKGDILTFTEVAATLGVTTNVSADDAATALGQLSNVLGLTASDYEHFGSTLVDLGNKGASTEAQILEIARRAGGTGKMIDLATSSTLGWAAAFANLGIQPELAGTAMQKFFQQSLRLSSSKGGAKALGAIAGLSGKAWKTAFDKDASGALERFIKGLGKLPKDKRIKAIDELFGKTSGISRALTGLAESYDRNLAPSIDTATTAWANNNAMTIEAQKRYETTASKLQILQNNVKTAAITIGSKLLPMLADLSVDAVGWIDEHQGDIEKFANDLRDGIRDAATWAKKLDWDKIGTALQAGAGAVKAIGEAFLGLPAPLLALLAGGFAVNKITGGVVVDIATDALKEGIFARGASPANPMWVKQVGVPVGGGAPGVPGGAAGAAAGGAGLLSTLLGLAGPILTVAALEIGGNEAAKQVNVDTAGRGVKTDFQMPAGFLDIPTTLSNLVQAVRVLNGTAATIPPAIRSELARNSSGSPDERDTRNAITRANDKVTTAVETMKGNLGGQLTDVKGAAQAAGMKAAGAAAMAGAMNAAATFSGSSQIVGAIRGIPAPVTYVKVEITASAVQKVTTQQSRNGGSSPSRDRDAGGAMGGH